MGKCICPKCGYSENYPKASFVFRIVEKPISFNSDGTPNACELKIECPKCGNIW